MSTGPARYAFAEESDALSEAREGYYAAVLQEFGVAGLAIVVALFLQFLVAGYRSVAGLHEPLLRSLGTNILALLALVVVYLFKGALLDYEPLNVYFWFYAGMLFKLPVLERTA